MDKIFEFGTQTDVGRVKQGNEDFSAQFETSNGEVFVVCDGMNGQVGGGTASRLAVESIRTFFNHQFYPQPQEALRQAVLFANEQIKRHSQQNPDLDGMGTTCVLLLLRDNLLFHAHVGDSRIYCLHESNLTQLTEDHSYVQGLVNQGTITKEEAFYHPFRNRIERFLGIEAELEVSVSEQPLSAQPGDIFMLCSDGLTALLTDDIFLNILLEPGNVSQKAARLVEAANLAGGIDNITVQLIAFPSLAETLPSVSETVVPEVLPEPNPPELIEKVIDNPLIISELKTVIPPPTTSPPAMTTQNPPVMPPASPQKSARKGPDWALIILCVLFAVVLILFFKGWDSLSADPAPGVSQNSDVSAAEPIEENPDSTLTVQPTQNQEVKPKSSNTTSTEKPKAKMPAGDTTITYTVKAGDNLRKLSERFNLKKATLQRLNNLPDDEIQADKKLKIKVRAVHTVGAGDVLSVVAERYGVSREAIKKANAMSENKTTRGTRLIIPLAKAE
jgi:serine/threonine protein phosphatase PrpC/LysM repeat protein